MSCFGPDAPRERRTDYRKPIADLKDDRAVQIYRDLRLIGNSR